MKTTALIAAALLATVLGNATAFANDGTPGIDRREHRQYHRILNGVYQGQLNRRETYRLLRGQARIHRMERRAKADGHLTWFERARIRAEQTRQSRRIYHDRHDWN